MYKPKNKKVKTASPNKRLRGILIAVIVVFLIIIFRIGWLQFVEGASLKEMMYDQLITSEILTPKRGSIYDSTGKTLAISAQVDTVSVDPRKFVQTDEDGDVDEFKTKAYREKIAKSFSDIFELDYEETLNKISTDSSFVVIAKKVEKDKIDRLREWMEKEEVYSGISIDEDTKRYYPYNNLASSLIGFCNDDNQGSEGLEYYWNSTLTGTDGKIVTSQDALRDYIPDENQTYIAPQNGSDLTLTIDANIQSIAEKYLKQGCIENEASRGGNVIIMDPNTGDILAMATYPDYNLNDPYTPTHIDSKEWNKMSSEDQTNTLYSLYKNRAISDTYEPGSVFKIITSAVALEEDLATTDTANAYKCTGVYNVSGINISCSHGAVHGNLSLRQALEKSCNAAFMQIGQKIGAKTLYSYYDAFGFFDKTNFASVGEASSNFWKLSDVGPIELATMSFGQRFNITPIQMITAVSAVANGGNLMQPRIVKEIKDTSTGAVQTVEPVTVRQVISKETSEKMLDMLESVVTDGTGKYAQVKGYSIAGKTGTSEPSPGAEDQGNVASFAAISPVESPQLVVLVTIYGPQGDNNDGSTVAAPIAAQILNEVLPYMQVPTDSTYSSNTEKITLPDVTNKTVGEAKKILEEAGFTVSTNGSDEDVITEQMPRKGTSLIENSIIKLYTSEDETKVSVTVPDLKMKTISQAKQLLKEKNLNIDIKGSSGVILTQDPISGTSVEEGSIITVTLQEQ